MSFLKKLGTFSAAVSVAALMVAGTAEAKNFKIAVGDSAGSAQEATGKAFGHLRSSVLPRLVEHRYQELGQRSLTGKHRRGANLVGCVGVVHVESLLVL